ncbi:hypothetical protein B566_EDAN005954 [Ephemera danica]|nr:hypothetical protein B566_EDAN005954 [Ephemera danica]
MQSVSERLSLQYHAACTQHTAAKMQEKQDSLTVTVKPADFPDNESFTTEPPPAYRQPRSTAVQVAKIVAVTVVAASAILGACILASAWIQARATCELMMMENQLHEAEIRAAEDRPQFQALVQESEEVTTSTTSAPATSTTSQQEEESQENEPQAHHQAEHHDMAMVVEQQHSAVPPVPLSAMTFNLVLFLATLIFYKRRNA